MPPDTLKTILHFPRLAVLAAMALLVACAPVGPDFVKPEVDMPPEWSVPADQGLQEGEGQLVEWWRVFDDPILDGLVQDALSGNNNLEIAGLRILEARAQLGIATGSLYPQSQFAVGDAAYVSPPDNSGGSSAWQYGLGASATWEIDFWGRFRRGIESADAAYMASIAAYGQAEVLLTSTVVDAYTILRTTEERLRIAYENLAIQQRSYDIAAVLYHNGAAAELDMQQAETLLLSTRATIPTLESALRQSRNALSQLLGQAPGGLEERLAPGAGIPALPDAIEVGFPADLLRRRPDVRQAELVALSQNALVGMAEADLYPSFSLTGSIGLSSGGGDSDFGDLFSSDALGFSIGPSFVWPFLNYGRIKNNVRVQDARLQQALVAYREAVLQAAREAEDAMAAFIGTRAQTDILVETVVSAERSNELSTLRYQEGFSDYQRVLNAQQALFTQQQRYIASQGDNVRSLIALYKALGGGWEGGRLPNIDPETLELMQERTDWGDLIEATYQQEKRHGRASDTRRSERGKRKTARAGPTGQRPGAALDLHRAARVRAADGLVSARRPRHAVHFPGPGQRPGGADRARGFGHHHRGVRGQQPAGESRAGTVPDRHRTLPPGGGYGRGQLRLGAAGGGRRPRQRGRHRRRGGFSQRHGSAGA